MDLDPNLATVERFLTLMMMIMMMMMMSRYVERVINGPQTR